uniref:Putative phosphate-induced protein 1 n=1 Tax=Helianthus annuus TaxID=4232 RepID=A0A251TI80_HELAN
MISHLLILKNGFPSQTLALNPNITKKNLNCDGKLIYHMGPVISPDITVQVRGVQNRISKNSDIRIFRIPDFIIRIPGHKSRHQGQEEPLPAQSKGGLYLVLTSDDIQVQDFCVTACGFHYFTFPSIVGYTLPYAWVGNSERIAQAYAHIRSLFQITRVEL